MAATQPVWQQLAVAGEFLGHKTGPFKLDAGVFDECVNNFEKDAVEVQWDIGHASEKGDGSAPAVGWISRLERRGNSLWGLTAWLPETRQAILEKRWQYASPAIRFSAKDPKSGRDVGAKLSSMALVSRGFLKDLAPVQANDGASGTLVMGNEIPIADSAAPTPAMRFAHPADRIAHERAIERAAERERAEAAKIESARNAAEVRRIMAEQPKTTPSTQNPQTKMTQLNTLTLTEHTAALMAEGLSYDDAFSRALERVRLLDDLGRTMADGTAGGARTRPTPLSPAALKEASVVMKSLRDADRDYAMVQARYNAPLPPIPGPGNFYAAAVKVASTDATLTRDQIDEMLRVAQIKDAEIAQARTDATLNPPMRNFPGTPVTA
jgi:hypothetical protein